MHLTCEAWIVLIGKGFLKLIEVFGWPHMLLIVILVFYYCFPKSIEAISLAIAKKIEEIRRFKKGDAEILFEPPKKITTEEKASEKYTKDDVIINLKKTNLFDEESINKYLDDCILNLEGNGIVYKRQLENLTSDERTIKILRSLYVSILNRPPKLPLDPSGLCSWGGYLFMNNCSQLSIDVVKNGLLQSQEYLEKHSPF